MTTMEAKIGTQNTRIIKLGAIKGPTPVITDKEKALFVLEENIFVIE